MGNVGVIPAFDGRIKTIHVDMDDFSLRRRRGCLLEGFGHDELPSLTVKEKMKKTNINPPKSLILASGSPRRQQILGRLGKGFHVISPEVDEARIAETPAALTLLNARAKAKMVWRKNPTAIVLAADTVVAEGGRILNKPETREEALAMILSLSGRNHEVFTGVVVAFSGDQGQVVCLEEVARSEVIFKNFDDITARPITESSTLWTRRGLTGSKKGGK